MQLFIITTGDHTTIVARGNGRNRIVETVSKQEQRNKLVELGVVDYVADGMVKGLWYRPIPSAKLGG